MRRISEGRCEITIFFYPGVKELNRNLFVYFINQHLHSKGVDIKKRFHYIYCPKCCKTPGNKKTIKKRLEMGHLSIICKYCKSSVTIPNRIEKYLLDSNYTKINDKISKKVESRMLEEHEKFKSDHDDPYKKIALENKDNIIHILHLSDIHMGTSNTAQRNFVQLISDLDKNLNVTRLDNIVISGDIGYHSTQGEYKAAFDFVDKLVNRYSLDSSRVIIVPGNHDLNWTDSENAYTFIPNSKLTPRVPEEACIPLGKMEKMGKLVRNDDLYKKRFRIFNDFFYSKIHAGAGYPLDIGKQGILYRDIENRILFLGLNSSWNIDHYYTKRAGINMNALSNALEQLVGNKYNDWIKIAVWHHPRELMDDDFLQLLTVSGFKIFMHGHIHEAQKALYEYDESYRIHIIGAGTFGAPPKDQVPGIPLQYNLLKLNKKNKTITVETRKKEKVDGAWYADARWGDIQKNPVSRYTINL